MNLSNPKARKRDFSEMKIYDTISLVYSYSSCMAGPQSSYSFRGLETAHRLGMSWRSIGLVVALAVAAFVLFTFFMFKSSQKNTDQMQQNIDRQIQDANDAAQKQALQIQADIQRQIDANVKKSQAGN